MLGWVAVLWIEAVEALEGALFLCDDIAPNSGGWESNAAISNGNKQDHDFASQHNVMSRDMASAGKRFLAGRTHLGPSWSAMVSVFTWIGYSLCTVNNWPGQGGRARGAMKQGGWKKKMNRV